MKHCPNTDCPSFQLMGHPAEFRDEIEYCSDCGARLKHGPGDEPAAPGEISPLVTLERFDDPLTADLARARLEAADIPVFFQDEHTARIRPYCALAVGIRLAVPRDRAREAWELLHDTPAPEFTPPACPRCRSEHIRRRPPSTGFLVFSILLLGLPLLLRSPALVCEDCGFSWKP